MSTIIVEGCDGSGKTRLCRHLLKGTGLSTIMISRSGPPASADTLEAQLRWLTGLPTDVNILCDRHPWISESVYGPVLRGESYLLKTIEQVGNILNEHREEIVVLYCRPPYPKMQEGIQSSRQLRGVDEKLRLLVAAYDTVIGKLEQKGARTIRYDWTQDADYKSITRLVKEYFLYGTLGQNFQDAVGADRTISQDL